MKDTLVAIQFIIDAAYVTRYHTVYTTQKETLGHHSFGVAAIIAILHPNCTSNLLKAALFHDIGEKKSGDMPADVKRELGLREVFAQFEKKTLEEYRVPYPHISPEEETRLKFADLLHGSLFCLWELKAGNNHVIESFLNYIRWMDGMKLGLQEVEKELLSWVREQALDYVNLPEAR